MPSDSHLARRASRSNMFVWARYKTGRRPCAVPTDKTVSAGDGFCLPDANHVSLSAIQKSGSLCVAIASRAVKITPFSEMNSVCWANRYSATGIFSSFIVSDGVGCCGSSKFISENTGVNDGTVSVVGVSKFDGNGNSGADSNSGAATVWVGAGVVMLGSKTDF